MAVARIGRQVGAIEFSVLDLAADFTYGAFQKSPNNPLPWYPNPTVGATVSMDLTQSLNLAVGTFNGGGPDQLTSWGWSAEGKTYTVGELTYRYSIEGRPGDLQGGYWHTSGSHDAVIGPATHHANHGVYFGWDQLICSEYDDPQQGLGTFAIYSWAPRDRNLVTHHVATGLVYRGLVPNRDADMAGIGLSIAEFSDDLAGFAAEETIELFYKIHVTETAIIQPAMYYISDPGGIRSDSLVVGVRGGLEL
jgi:carbohydrate-selective porin OprB